MILGAGAGAGIATAAADHDGHGTVGDSRNAPDHRGVAGDGDRQDGRGRPGD